MHNNQNYPSQNVALESKITWQDIIGQVTLRHSEGSEDQSKM